MCSWIEIGNYDNSAIFHVIFCCGSFFNDLEGTVIVDVHSWFVIVISKFWSPHLNFRLIFWVHYSQEVKWDVLWRYSRSTEWPLWYPTKLLGEECVAVVLWAGSGRKEHLPWQLTEGRRWKSSGRGGYGEVDLWHWRPTPTSVATEKIEDWLMK